MNAASLAPDPPAAVRPGEVGGAQSIKRAMAVLRYVASHPDGARLRDVSRDCGLNKATCHRILAALVEEDFLQPSEDGGGYILGQEALAIGWAARARQDIPALARAGMVRLSVQTGDTVFLSIRSGLEAICIAREVGAFPIKTLTLDIGSRRPLGVGSGSMALFAFLPAAERAEALDAVEPRLGAYPALSRESLVALAERTRHLGYSFNDEGVIEGMSAVGVPVLGDDGLPMAALSVAAISTRMQAPRRLEVVDLLLAEARLLSRAMTGTR
ncbi:IclR family transcriptional regulator [Enterovirga rhinocerotis]|uniref:IclR family transcriptional regulator n=1 Tax=Enterovirga rhinocerotis TaxID=1339210 RepID=A0A4R7C5G1_9HYPH|nr:IclR family transcriptional regulator [Enterovirga rhinocerotis]TDR93421.1 IclR family transcriptional regulator [Enterovirga rhinocerotis]